MLFFCNDLTGHNIEIKDTFLVEYMGDGGKEKPLSYV